MPGSAAVDRVRPEIAMSWARVRAGGLDPDTALAEPLPVAEHDSGSRLAAAALPVLEQLEAKLSGTGCCVLLADDRCSVVHTWYDDSPIADMFDAIGVVPGALLGEDRIGTNAIGTAFELRQSITIHATDHFARPLRAVSCYGQPIRNPVTRRIEGILDITARSATVHPLIGPLAAQAVEDIERRLMDGARSSERALLAAFQEACAHRVRPLAALGDDLVLFNRAAMDILDPADVATLALLAGGSTGAGAAPASVALTDGSLVSVRISPVPGARGGSLFRIEPAPADQVRAPRPRAAQGATPAAPAPGRPLLVTGLPGTGRSHRARAVAGGGDVLVLDAACLLTEGDQAWAQRAAEALTTGAAPVVVDGIDLLPDAVLSLLTRLVLAAPGPVVLVSGPRDGLGDRAAALAGLCADTVETPPLASRRGEFPEIARSLLAEIVPGCALRLAPSTVDALAGQPWPGNLHELRGVLTHAARGRRIGILLPADLPHRYRTAPPPRPLRGMEQAEREAIVLALARHGGNKARAAEALGVSRTTLYARIRALRVAT